LERLRALLPLLKLDGTRPKPMPTPLAQFLVHGDVFHPDYDGYNGDRMLRLQACKRIIDTVAKIDDRETLLLTDIFGRSDLAAL